MTLDDHRKYPVWTSAHDERHDEEWEKPIISTSEVTQEIINCQVIAPIITVRVQDRDIWGTAWLGQDEQEIFAISIWYEGRWKMVSDIGALTPPIIFVSVPKILGVEDVQFVCTNPKDERASRVA